MSQIARDSDRKDEQSGVQKLDQLTLSSRLDHGIYPILVNQQLLALLHVQVEPSKLELLLETDVPEDTRRTFQWNDSRKQTFNLGYCSHPTGTSWGHAERKDDGTVRIFLRGLFRKTSGNRDFDFSKEVARISLHNGMPRLDSF